MRPSGFKAWHCRREEECPGVAWVPTGWWCTPEVDTLTTLMASTGRMSFVASCRHQHFSVQGAVGHLVDKRGLHDD